MSMFLIKPIKIYAAFVIKYCDYYYCLMKIVNVWGIEIQKNVLARNNERTEQNRFGINISLLLGCLKKLLANIFLKYIPGNNIRYQIFTEKSVDLKKYRSNIQTYLWKLKSLHFFSQILPLILIYCPNSSFSIFTIYLYYLTYFCSVNKIIIDPAIVCYDKRDNPEIIIFARIIYDTQLDKMKSQFIMHSICIISAKHTK